MRKRREDDRGQGLRALFATMLPLALVATLLAGATGCGMAASAGKLGGVKVGVGMPVDVDTAVDAAHGEATVTGVKTGAELASVAIYWPAVLSEATAWLADLLPRAAALLGGGGGAAGPPAQVADRAVGP